MSSTCRLCYGKGYFLRDPTEREARSLPNVRPPDGEKAKGKKAPPPILMREFCRCHDGRELRDLEKKRAKLEKRPEPLPPVPEEFDLEKKAKVARLMDGSPAPRRGLTAPVRHPAD